MLFRFGPHQQEQLSARIRDISRGGIQLIVNHAFEPGDLLTVEIPRSDDKAGHSLLACIVRVAPLHKDEWCLGCVFSRELSAEDLADFGATKKKPHSSDQRQWMRFPCNLQARFSCVGPANPPSISAQVLNISASGIGLLVKEPMVTGTLVNLQLQSGTGKESRFILGCVVHVTTQAEGEWALGCNFIRELSEEDLQALL